MHNEWWKRYNSLISFQIVNWILGSGGWWDPASLFLPWPPVKLLGTPQLRSPSSINILSRTRINFFSVARLPADPWQQPSPQCVWPKILCRRRRRFHQGEPLSNLAVIKYYLGFVPGVGNLLCGFERPHLRGLSSSAETFLGSMDALEGQGSQSVFSV